MSIHALSWVLRHSEAKLGPRLVLLVLADHARDDGTCAWPAVDTIAAHARLTRRAVQSALRVLEQEGHIVVRGRSKAGTTIYDVVMGGVAATRAESSPRVVDDAVGAQMTTQGGVAATPDPSGTVIENRQEKNAREPHDFAEWMGYHNRVTGLEVLKAGTKARAHVAAMFGARLEEGYSLDDLKAAVRGAHANDYRRENGYVGAESVLRPTKIGQLIAAGRKVPEPGAGKYDGFPDA